MLTSSNHGRWILSSSEFNSHHPDNHIKCPKGYKSTAFQDVPKLKPGQSRMNLYHNIVNDSLGYVKVSKDISNQLWGNLASGDPCIIRSPDQEEMEEPSWFYAPYNCRYHFYTKFELHQCFQIKNIRHIHFNGDSMSRDLFAYFARYLGISEMKNEEMKHLTNELKKKKLQSLPGDTIVTQGMSRAILQYMRSMRTMFCLY